MERLHSSELQIYLEALRPGSPLRQHVQFLLFLLLVVCFFPVNEDEDIDILHEGYFL